jgi:hypothetical protein
MEIQTAEMLALEIENPIAKLKKVQVARYGSNSGRTDSSRR